MAISLVLGAANLLLILFKCFFTLASFFFTFKILPLCAQMSLIIAREHSNSLNYRVFSSRKESSLPGSNRLFMGKQLQYQIQLLHSEVDP